MIITKLRIDSQMFFLEPGQDVAALKRQILTAARGVADFVIFTTVGHGEVAVLMTPATPVRFEQQEHSDEQIAAWEENPPEADFVLSEPEWVL
jgi:hypothetical protein